MFSAGHPLGADQLGRDMLSRIVWGTRVSLAVGLIAAVTAAVIGSTIGIVAGFCGRWVDGVLMRAIDMLMAFPYLLLALAIVAALGSRPAQRAVRDLHRQHPVLRPRRARRHRRPEAARLCRRRPPRAARATCRS